MSKVIEFRTKPKPDNATKLRRKLESDLKGRLVGPGSADLCADLASAAVDAMQRWDRTHAFTLNIDLSDAQAVREQLERHYEQIGREAMEAIAKALLEGAFIAAKATR